MGNFSLYTESTLFATGSYTITVHQENIIMFHVASYMFLLGNTSHALIKGCRLQTFKSENIKITLHHVIVNYSSNKVAYKLELIA